MGVTVSSSQTDQVDTHALRYYRYADLANDNLSLFTPIQSGPLHARKTQLMHRFSYRNIIAIPNGEASHQTDDQPDQQADERYRLFSGVKLLSTVTFGKLDVQLMMMKNAGQHVPQQMFVEQWHTLSEGTEFAALLWDTFTDNYLTFGASGIEGGHGPEKLIFQHPGRNQCSSLEYCTKDLFAASSFNALPYHLFEMIIDRCPSTVPTVQQAAMHSTDIKMGDKESHAVKDVKDCGATDRKRFVGGKFKYRLNPMFKSVLTDGPSAGIDYCKLLSETPAPP
jgi:hypothetical protein